MEREIHVDDQVKISGFQCGGNREGDEAPHGNGKLRGHAQDIPELLLGEKRGHCHDDFISVRPQSAAYLFEVTVHEVRMGPPFVAGLRKRFRIQEIPENGARETGAPANPAIRRLSHKKLFLFRKGDPRALQAFSVHLEELAGSGLGRHNACIADF
jgi:hypothetical protein